jgi:hypothetical protein
MAISWLTSQFDRNSGWLLSWASPIRLQRLPNLNWYSIRADHPQHNDDRREREVPAHPA